MNEKQPNNRKQNRMLLLVGLAAVSILALLLIQPPPEEVIGILVYDTKGDLLCVEKLSLKEPSATRLRKIESIFKKLNQNLDDNECISSRFAVVTGEFKVEKSKITDFQNLYKKYRIRMYGCLFRVRKEGPKFYIEVEDPDSPNWNPSSSSSNSVDCFEKMARVIAEQIDDALTTDIKDVEIVSPEQEKKIHEENLKKLYHPPNSESKSKNQ